MSRAEDAAFTDKQAVSDNRADVSDMELENYSDDTTQYQTFTCWK